MDERPSFAPSESAEKNNQPKKKKTSFTIGKKPKQGLPSNIPWKKVILGVLVLVVAVFLLNSLLCSGGSTQDNNASPATSAGDSTRDSTRDSTGDSTGDSTRDNASGNSISGDSPRKEYSGDVVITVAGSEDILSDEVQEREGLISEYLKVNDIDDLGKKEKRDAAIYQLIQVAWSREAGSQAGIQIPPATVQKESAVGGGALTENLLSAGYSEAQVEDLIRLELIRQELKAQYLKKSKKVPAKKVRKAYKKSGIKKPFRKVKAKLKRKIRTKQIKQASKGFESSYQEEWRAQTACAPDYKVDACGEVLK